MRIVFLQATAHPNQWPLLEALVGDGHDVLYLLHRPSADRPVPDGVACERLGWSPFATALVRWLVPTRATSAKQKQVGLPPLLHSLRILRCFRPDVVIVKQWFLYYAAFAGLARVMGIPVVLYDQKGVHSTTEGRLGQWLTRARCKPRVVYTPVLGFPEDPGAVRRRALYVPFAAKPRLLEAGRERTPGTPIRLLMVGRVNTPRKRAMDAVVALAGLRRRHAVALTILGSELDETREPGRSVAEFVEANGLGEYVEIRQVRGREAMDHEYRSHDLFVLPSVDEPASVSQLEAMAFGLPVVISDRNRSRCYVEDGRNGRWFRGMDASDLERVIDELLGAPGELARMGAESLALVRDRYGPEHFLRRFRRVMRLAVEGRGLLGHGGGARRADRSGG